jgi:hypothetical protein
MEQIKQAFIRALTAEVKGDNTTEEVKRDNTIEINFEVGRLTALEAAELEFDEEEQEERFAYPYDLEEWEPELELNTRITKSLNTIISKDVIINNYCKLLKTDYKTHLNSFKLRDELCQRIKFEVEDGTFVSRISNLDNCLIGDIEIEMDVPDDTEICLSFVTIRTHIINNSHIFVRFKDKKAKTNLRTIDFSGCGMRNRDIATLERLKKLYLDVMKITKESNLMTVQEFEHTFNFMYEHLNDSLSLYNAKLELRITTQRNIPLDCNMNAIFKCRYRRFDIEKLEYLKQLISSYRQNVTKYQLKNIESLY